MDAHCVASVAVGEAAAAVPVEEETVLHEPSIAVDPESVLWLAHKQHVRRDRVMLAIARANTGRRQSVVGNIYSYPTHPDILMLTYRHSGANHLRGLGASPWRLARGSHRRTNTC